MSHATANLLRERHGLDRGEAEHILGSFVDAVESSLEEFGICHVAGVGTFVRAPGEKRISFEPAEPLSRAVNVRFADLPVYEVDLLGESDRPAAPVTPPIAEADRTVAPDRTEQDAPSPTEAGTGMDEEVSEPEADEVIDQAEPEATEVIDASDPEPAELSSANSPEEASDAGSSDAESTELDKPVSAPSLAGSRSPRRRRRERSGGNRAVWFAFPIVIALIAAAVWFFQRPGSDSETTAGNSITSARPFEAQPADPTGTEPESGDVDEGPVTLQAEVANDGGQTPAEATPDDDAPAPSDSQPAYSLDRSVDGYTLIVGSSPDRAAADEQMSNYTELDLPFGVLDYSEEESSMYRLAIGLYDSAQQADSARQAMAGALPSGTWVWRIR